MELFGGFYNLVIKHNVLNLIEHYQIIFIMNNQIQQLVEKLQLTPHPEGGFFKETHRSEGIISEKQLASNFIGDRNYSTCIYFLLVSGNFSAFHRIKQDEIWHFYGGSPILLSMISPDGDYSLVEIGNDFEANQVPQFIVPAGYWFASEVKNPDSYSLAGCTVSPGFDFRDFELPNRSELVSLFPQHGKAIARLTRE